MDRAKLLQTKNAMVSSKAHYYAFSVFAFKSVLLAGENGEGDPPMPEFANRQAPWTANGSPHKAPFRKIA
jgi:hypothetical protein